MTYVKRSKTVILGLFWAQREPQIPSYFAQKFENHSKKLFMVLTHTPANIL